MQRLTIPNDPPPGAPTPAGAPQGSATTLPPGAANSVVSDAEALAAAGNANIPIISADGATGGVLTPGTMSGNGVSVGSLIDGKTATELMDAVLPAALVFVLYKAGMQIKKTELQLTEKEKNTLAPLMQKCMDALLLNFDSPFVALGISMTVIYGGKIMEKGGVAWLDKQNAAKVKPVDTVTAAIKQNAGLGTTAVKEEPNGLRHSFTEANVEAFAKKRKVSREKAIKLMIGLVERGKMTKEGNQ